MVNTTKQPGTSENAAQGAVQPRFGEVRIRQRGRLPHWEKEAGLYFVTFHLADSLPKQVLEKISARYRVLETANRTGANLLPDQKALVEEYSIKRIEEYFDRGIGACSLRDPRIGELVANAMRFLARESIPARGVVHNAESCPRDLPLVSWTGVGQHRQELEDIYRKKSEWPPWAYRNFLATGIL